MPLRRVSRTFGFRLTLLYAVLFAVSTLILFVVVSWSATGFLAQEIDATVENELTEIQAFAGDRGEAGLRDAIAGVTARTTGIYGLLQSADGKVLAGNMLPLHPLPGPRVLLRTHQPFEYPASGGIRGRGLLLPDGGYLFVGVTDLQIDALRAVLTRSFLVGLGATLIFAVAAGLTMTLSILRRIDRISRASRAIMAGDLGQRIALHGANDELDRLAASLNSMLDRIQELMSGLQQVSNDIAHDLRTPLTRLRQRLEMARRRTSTVEDLHAALDCAICNVDEILGTFGAVLRIAQIEAGTRRAGFAPVELSQILEGLVEAYLPLAEQNEQVLEGRVTSDLQVFGDRELLTQLFANLIHNAIAHTPRKALITVETIATNGLVRIVVADTGPGIPPEFRRKVLQRFYRMESSRTTPGNGLGLSLADAVASLHRAQLELQDNNPGLRCIVELMRLRNLPKQTGDRPRLVTGAANSGSC